MKKHRGYRLAVLLLACIMVFSIWNPLSFATENHPEQDTDESVAPQVKKVIEEPETPEDLEEEDESSNLPPGQGEEPIEEEKVPEEEKKKEPQTMNAPMIATMDFPDTPDFTAKESYFYQDQNGVQDFVYDGSTNDHTQVRVFWVGSDDHFYLAFRVHPNHVPNDKNNILINENQAESFKIYGNHQQVLTVTLVGETEGRQANAKDGTGGVDYKWVVADFGNVVPSGIMAIKVDVNNKPFNLGVDATFQVIIIKQDISVEKVWDGPVGDPVTLELFEEGASQAWGTITLDGSESSPWKGAFKDVPMVKDVDNQPVPIEYELREIEIPGYTSDITGDADNGFIVTNVAKTGSLKIKKVGEDGETPIMESSATFALYQEEEVKYTATTDQGVATFEEILPGTYSLKETLAPEGYELDPSIYTVKVEPDDDGNIEVKVLDSEDEEIPDINPLVITNTLMKGKLVVEKVDDNGDTITQNPATFVLKQDNQIKATQQTGDDGKVIFTGLLPGTYTLEETQAPEGYELDNTIYDVNVELVNEEIKVLVNDQEVTEEDPLKVTNTILGTLTITKEISEGDGQHDPNQNFVFEIKQYEVKENGDKGALVKTFYETIRVDNSNNSRTILDLPKGYYEVTEKADWSWQHEADGPLVKDGTLGIQGNSSIETSFTNTPKKVSWLTSIDWVVNLFTGGGN